MNRVDFVNVKFMSITGQRHHLILPFRESRILQYHMHLLEAADPMKTD